MAKARKMTNGKWRIQPSFVDNTGGIQRASFTELTKREAEYKAAEWLMMKREEALPENMSVGTAMDRFIEARNSILSASTVRGYKQIRQNRFQGIMDIKLAKLTNEDIQKAINMDSVRLKPKTVINGYTLLAQTLEAYHPSFNMKANLPKKIAYDAQIPDDSEFVLLVQDTMNTMMGAVVLLAACAGLRRSELCALTWDDVDEKSNVLVINKACVLNDQKKWIIKTTKTEASTRRIKIPRVVVANILALPRESERIVPITPNAVTDRFIRIRDRLKINIRLHDLRHYNASVMHALNVPDKYAMSRGGWSSTHTMKKVYQHTFSNKQRKVDDTVNAYFEKLISGEEGEEESKE